MSILQRMIQGLIPMNQMPNIDAYLPYMNIGGFNYPLSGVNQTLTGKQEEITDNFVGLVQGAYRRNGCVFAVETARQMLFAQARFQYQRLVKGRPGDLWGDTSLAPLEHPWDGGTTGDLLTRMIQDNDIGGDGFVIRRGDRLRRARPDWVTLVLGSFDDPKVDGLDLDADVLGLLYHPGGYSARRDPETYMGKRTVNGRTFPSEFAHFALIPDPLGFHRGIPWLSAIVPNVAAPSAATAHKLQFFNNGATVNMVVSNVPGATKDQFDDWVKSFEAKHRGIDNSYRTLYLAGATTATPVGSNFQQMDFREVQGMDEVAICYAGQVPPNIVGVSEGLQGSTLNAGNYAASMRRFANLFAYPAWQNVASSLEAIVPPPSGSRLWYDSRDIPALKDDIKDAATVQGQQAQSIRTLVDGGFIAATAVKAVISGDLSLLEHTGLFPVQMQAPGAKNMPLGETPSELPELPGRGPQIPAEAPGTDVPIGTEPPSVPVPGKKATP